MYTAAVRWSGWREQGSVTDSVGHDDSARSWVLSGAAGGHVWCMLGDCAPHSQSPSPNAPALILLIIIITRECSLLYNSLGTCQREAHSIYSPQWRRRTYVNKANQWRGCSVHYQILPVDSKGFSFLPKRCIFVS